MNSKEINNWKPIKRRLILAVGILVAIATTVFAHHTDEEKLTKAEAQALIDSVKVDLVLEEPYEPIFIFDEEGFIEESEPLTIIKIYDSQDVLMLEAPISKLRQLKNKHLRKLLNASDYLTQYGQTKYYRLDL